MPYFRVRRWTSQDSVRLGLIEAPDEGVALRQLRDADPARAGTETYWLKAPAGGFTSVQEAISDARRNPIEAFDPADLVVRTATEIASICPPPPGTRPA